MLKCENCGEEITKERYLSVDIMSLALCDIYKDMSKQARKKRLIKMLELNNKN